MTGITSVDWIVGIQEDSGIDTKRPDAIQRIKEEAEKAKIALSSQEYDQLRSSPPMRADRSIQRNLLFNSQ